MTVKSKPIPQRSGLFFAMRSKNNALLFSCLKAERRSSNLKVRRADPQAQRSLSVTKINYRKI